MRDGRCEASCARVHYIVSAIVMGPRMLSEIFLIFLQISLVMVAETAGFALV
jgi:hypothetical protein